MDLTSRLGEPKDPIDLHTEDYLREMRYLRNFTEKTLDNCKQIFKRWKRFVGGMPDEKKLTEFVIKMREAGLSVTTCNITIRTFNSFLVWLREKGITEPLRMKLLPEEKKKKRVLKDEHIKALLAFKPQGTNENRIYAIAATLIDTGLRITECLTIETARVDFDNLLITVMGKGRKERVVPMSIELRRILYRYYIKHRKGKFENPWFFCTSFGNKMTYRNAYRDLERVFKKAGVDKENMDGFFHSFRRGFSRNYVRNGGNLFYLQAAMGHATLEMTKKYVEVEDEDLKTTHLRTSLLSRLK
ncbi:MAG: tyrosine-type recombinase/integrase [Blastocatellales bacterium]